MRSSGRDKLQAGESKPDLRHDCEEMLECPQNFPGSSGEEAVVCEARCHVELGGGLEARQCESSPSGGSHKTK